MDMIEIEVDSTEVVKVKRIYLDPTCLSKYDVQAALDYGREGWTVMNFEYEDHHTVRLTLVRGELIDATEDDLGAINTALSELQVGEREERTLTLSTGQQVYLDSDV